jgi:autotransporter-associated beta strand protein
MLTQACLTQPVMNLNRLLKSCVCVLAACAAVGGGEARADATYHNLGGGNFTQDWTNSGLITTNDSWSGVPSVLGYLGDNPATTATPVDPRTLTASIGVTEDVIANQTNPNTATSGGVAEFDTLSNPTVAIQGSGTADWPYIQIHLNVTNRQSVQLTCNLRDIDGSTDNSVQQIAVQYRVGTSGDFVDLPTAYVADASEGPSLATLVTPVNVTLPAAVNGAAQVQVRVMTTNATGSDEWIGIDDIVVSSAPNATPVITGPVTGPTTFTTTYGVASAVQTFSVSGTDLTAPIVATAPTGFEVSNDGTTWGATASFAPTSGAVTGATLSVRLKANAAVTGVYDSVVIALTSTGAVAVNLTTPATGSSVTATGLTIAANAVSKPLGAELAEVNPGSTAFVPTGLVNGELVGSVTITYGAGRLAADLAQVYTGSVVPSAATGGTFTASNYSISYTAADLTVTASPTVTLGGTFAAMTAEYGTASVAQSFTVSGGALTADVVVGAPVGFEVSDAPAGTYGASVTLTQTGGAVASTTLYLRMKGNNPFGAVAAGDVTATSTGATTVTLAVPAGSVSQKALTITGLAGVNKFYDKTLAATIAGTAVLNGVVSGDGADVTLDGTGATAAFGQVGQGTGLPVTVTGFVLGGTKAGNYALTQPALTANIDRKELTLLGAAVVTRAFNGGVVATITGALDGVILPDVVTFTGTGAFDNAGPGDPIAVTAAVTLGGADAGNYTIKQPTGLTGRINGGGSGATIAQWLFNGATIPGGTSAPTPSVGTGTAALVSGATGSSASGLGSSDTATVENLGWTVTTFPAQGADSATRGAQFNVSTVGASGVQVVYDIRHSNTAPRHAQIQYTTDGTVWQNFGPVQTLTTVGSVWTNNNVLDFSSTPGVNNNANFGVRILAAFDPAGTAYVAAAGTSAYGSGGTWRFDNVRVTGNPPFQFVSSTPEHLATGVAVSSPIVLNFSAPALLSATAVTLVDQDSNVIPFTGLPVTTAAAAVTLTPTGPLPYGKTITATLVAAEITSATAAPLGATTTTIPVRFTTEALVAPVVNVTPTAVTSPISTDVTLTANVTAGSQPVTLQWYEGTASNFAGATLLPGKTESTLVVQRPTVGVVSYFVRATNPGAQVADSNDAVVTYTDFPVVTSTVPAADAVGVAQDGTITLNFSKAVQLEAGAVSFSPAVGFAMVPDFGGPTLATSFVLTPTAPLAAGTLYTVTVDKTKVKDAVDAGMDADKVFSFTTRVPVSITTPPVAQSVVAGATATFTVVAAGDGPLSYDWQKGGVSLGAPDSATLTITNAQEVNEGSYRVVVTGPGVGNSATSVAVLLNVQSPNDPFELPPGTSYAQNFDGIATGLPAGWSVRTLATATGLGGIATFNTAAVEWGVVSGGFRNSAAAAAATNLPVLPDAAAQAASANRALAVRQVGTAGANLDPGAAFAFTFNTTGKTLTQLSLSLQMLNVQPRSTTWSLQVGIGAEPAAWETVEVFTDPGAFGATTVTLTESKLSSIEDKAQVWIRVVALSTSTGSGTRDTFGIDDFSMTYQPINPGLFWDKDGAVAGAGGPTPTGAWGTDAYWGASALGDALTAGWISGEGATFAAGSNAIGDYTVTVSGTQSTRALSIEEGQVTLSGGVIELTGTSPRVRVVAGKSVIGSEIQGAAGLRKLGAGTLALAGINTFTGPVSIGAGGVEIGADTALGAVSNGITLSGTLVTTATLTLPATRAITGEGTLSPTTGTILTVAGSVTMPTGLTLAGGGGVGFTGSTLQLGPLKVAQATEITGNELDLTGFSALHTTGSTLVGNVVDFVASTPTFFVESGATVRLNGGVKLGGGGTNRLIKTGAGTLVLPTANLDLNKISLGLQGLPATNGGVIEFGSRDALGITQAFFNYGELKATAAMTGVDAIPIGFSIGGREGSEAVLTASAGAIEIAGESALFAGAGTLGDIVLRTTGAVTFGGDIVIAGAAASIDALRLEGSGAVTFAGTKAGLNKPVKVRGTVSLVLNTEALGNGGVVGAAGLDLGAGTELVLGTDGTTRLVTGYSGLTAASGSVLKIDIGGRARGTEYDALELASPTAGGGAVTFAGTVSVKLVSDYVPAAGDVFKVLGWANDMTADFTGVVFDLPALSGGLSWDTSFFATTGALVIARANGAPTIVVGPQSKDAAVGDNVTFSVVASGTGPLNYVWRRNGQPFGAANGSSLSLTNVAQAQAAVYSVVVSNTAGSATSDGALLVVGGFPVITVPPQSASVAAGTTVTFSVTAEGPGTFSYVWERNEGPLSGEIGSNLQVVAGTTTLGNYRVIVTNGAGSTTSAVAVLSLPTSGPPTSKPEWDLLADLPAGQIGVPYAFDLNVKADLPGAVPPIFRSATSFSMTGQPTGLVINATTGEITGTPAAIKSTPYAVSVTARNAFGSAILKTRILINPLPTGALGVFTGPIGRSALLEGIVTGGNGALGGRFDMTVASTGVASGKVTIGTKVYSFSKAKAVIPAAPANRLSVAATIKLSTTRNLTVSVLVDTLTGTILNTSTISDGTATVTLTGWRNPWSKLNPATALAGYYTTKVDLVSTTLTSAQAPLGAGYLSFTVSPTTGGLTLAGKLSDGSSISMATFAGPAGQMLMFRTLYGTTTRGSLLGSLGIAEEANPLNNTVSGPMTWTRPANTASSNRLYRTGFPAPGLLDVTLTGARYVAPPARTNANPLAEPRVMGLTDLSNQIEVLLTKAGVETALPLQADVKATVALTNKVAFNLDKLVNTRAMSLTFSASKGSFTGKATLRENNPVLAAAVPPVLSAVTRTVTFQGLLVGGVGHGYFILNQLPAVGANPAQTTSNTPQEGGRVEVKVFVPPVVP